MSRPKSQSYKLPQASQSLSIEHVVSCYETVAEPLDSNEPIEATDEAIRRQRKKKRRMKMTNKHK